jgi:hypothetical protein
MSDHISDKVDFKTEADSSDKATSNIKVELAPEEHGHLTVGDILRGTAVHELTPFERKAALINA